MRIRRRLAWSLGLLALFGVALLTGYWPRENAQPAHSLLAGSTPPSATQPGKAASGATPSAIALSQSSSPAASQATTSSPRPISLVVLPPEGVPAAKVIAELRAAADHGNPSAGCRVAAEIIHCRDVRQQLGELQAMEADLAKSRNPQDSALLSKQLENLTNTLRPQQASCEGVSDLDYGQSWRYLWQAAQAGNVAAMSKFVRDPGLSYDEPAAAAEGWASYQSAAPQLLWQAIQGGDVMALYQGWFSAASGLSAGGKGVFPRDPYTALVYGNAVLPLVDPRRQDNINRMNARLAAELTPAQALQAAGEGMSLRSKYFAGAQPARETSNDGYMDPAKCAS